MLSTRVLLSHTEYRVEAIANLDTNYINKILVLLVPEISGLLAPGLNLDTHFYMPFAFQLIGFGLFIS